MPRSLRSRLAATSQLPTGSRPRPHFANPAVTIARTLTDTFAGIQPASVPAFVAAQLAGGIAAVALARYLWPTLPAADLIVPHQPADAV